MSNVRRLSPAEAFEKLNEGYTYLDVRSEPEFDEGHPKGAVNIPLLHAGAAGMAPNPDFLEVVRANFQKDARLVVGCKAGGRSLRAAEILIADGYKDILDQKAGWDGVRNPFGQITEPGWSKVPNLPSETGAPTAQSYTTLRSRMPKQV